MSAYTILHTQAEFVMNVHNFITLRATWLVDNPACGQLTRESSRLRVRVDFARQFGRPVPHMVTPRLLPPTLHDGINLYRQPPSGQSRVYRVTQACIDTVNCNRVSPEFIGPINCVPRAFTTKSSLALGLV